jgi:hypothetical protein
MTAEYTDLAHKLLDIAHEGATEIDAHCPFHGEDSRPSLRFNVESGLWYCHTCHAGGNADTLSLKVSGFRAGRGSFESQADVLETELEAFGRAQARARSLISTDESVSVIYKGKRVSVSSTTGKTSTGEPIENVNPAENDGLYHEETFSPVNLRTRTSKRAKADDLDYAALFGIAISGQRDLVVEESVLARYRNPTTYWTGHKNGERGFDPAWAEVFELGYDVFEDAYSIPIRNETGHLCGVNLRYNDGYAKYKLPAGFERKRHLFGSWLAGRYRVDRPDTAVLTEGATDAIACWHVGYQGFAVYGSSVSDEQVRLLHRMGIRNVIMAFDDDEAGRECARSTWRVMRPFFAGEVRWPIHPRQRHTRSAKGYDAAELYLADPDTLARTLDRVRLT